ncbi:hypothetical protein E0Z10_g10126 [Xylaria hypoxylon]|uniref:Uncharacterized protein n=1 Tax=Xylaria hypoxylon TaxID=37992 RepID=A0A4Z0YIX2_9PEZI|nr:hypothetical protein E0Z10_g10126 [Xylaria hypoxylon]
MFLPSYELSGRDYAPDDDNVTDHDTIGTSNHDNNCGGGSPKKYRSRNKLTQTNTDGAGGSDPKPTIGLANEPITTDLPATKDTPLGHVDLKVLSTDSQTVTQGKSVTGSQSSPSPPSPHSLLSPSITTPVGESSEPTSSGQFPPPSELASKTKSAASSRVSPPTTISLLVPASPSTLNEGHGGLNVGLVILIAVGTTLIALLLLGAAAYCGLKRRKARRSDRLRTLTLSRESMPSLGFEVPYEWKPPVELPHHNAPASRPELEYSCVFRSRDSDSQSAPGTPSSLSPNSPSAPRDAAEPQGDPPPAELFVMPAELPAVCEI